MESLVIYFGAFHLLDPLRIRPPDMDLDSYLFRGDRAYSKPSIYPFKQCACWIAQGCCSIRKILPRACLLQMEFSLHCYRIRKTAPRSIYYLFRLHLNRLLTSFSSVSMRSKSIQSTIAWKSLYKLVAGEADSILWYATIDWKVIRFLGKSVIEGKFMDLHHDIFFFLMSQWQF
jgi:hypothetical protein